MSNFPSDSTFPEPNSSSQPAPQGGEDFLGLEQELGERWAGTPAPEESPAPAIPEVQGEPVEAGITPLMGSEVGSPEVHPELPELPEGTIQFDPQAEQQIEPLLDPELDFEDDTVAGPGRGRLLLVCGATLTIAVASQWTTLSALVEPYLSTFNQSGPVASSPAPLAQPPAQMDVAAAAPAVTPVESARPAASNSPLRARLAALFRLAASSPVTPSPREVPGVRLGNASSRDGDAQPHRGKRSFYASLGLILAQSQGAEHLQMGQVLLGGGWDPVGPGTVSRASESYAPEGLGVDSGADLVASEEIQTSNPVIAGPAMRSGAPTHEPTLLVGEPTLESVATEVETSTQDPARGLTVARSGNRWTRSEIPEGAISLPNRMLTPGVGHVRVVLHGGEVFEGRLHQVGQGQVWIDTGLGRMTLESHRIDHMQKLSSEAVAARNGDGLGSRQPDQLTQVSVAVPRGFLTGTLLSRDGDRVTLLTSAGLQITVTSDDIRPLAGSNATLGIRLRGTSEQE